MIIVLDLSKPQELWITLETLLDAVQARINKVSDRISTKDGNQLRLTLREKRSKEIPEKLFESYQLTVFPIPLTIIGTKFDHFLHLHVNEQRMINKVLRLVALHLGASLFVLKDGLHINRIKAWLQHLAFGSPYSQNVQTEFGKPLIIPVGSSSTSGIGKYTKHKVI
ncbi:unnamed protein product [Protopolystoma xenopodis]|uniref:Uncharacterized protein n=1 Tax=Protopolystoma xenopodis TaxID=117903 RepID=A0A448X5T1_9PLAT|nr:unnamed protein product [Protopolystoma xenopodis]